VVKTHDLISFLFRESVWLLGHAGLRRVDALIDVVLQIEVLGEGPVDKLGEENLAAAVGVDRVKLWNKGKVQFLG
jgi:hypothetical protein